MNPEVAFEELAEDFRRYLLEVRALKEESLRKHLGAFRRFGGFLKLKRVQAARRVSLGLVYEFLGGFPPGLSRRYLKTLHVSMRVILRFLHFARVAPRDLSLLLQAPTLWRLADVPKAFSREQVKEMLACLKSRTPYDHRERAIVLLFVCYGLRLGEVARMTLDDVDWKDKTISVPERKNKHPLILPLLPAVEGALRDYLAHFRPEGLETRRLWITIKRRSRAPLKAGSVHHIVKKFLRRVGTKGCATMFRHTLATHLINSDVSLEGVQAVLGHRSVESTRIYAKVHWEALKEAAQNYSLRL